jgi:cytochrome c oxidase cbb3-type subunit 4
MSVDHDTVVWIAKSYGLVYLVIFSIIVVLYAYWPKNKKGFDEAAKSILTEEDRPWQ